MHRKIQEGEVPGMWHHGRLIKKRSAGKSVRKCEGEQWLRTGDWSAGAWAPNAESWRHARGRCAEAGSEVRDLQQCG